MSAGETLLRVKNLKKYYPVRAGLLRRVVNQLRAVDDVSFEIRKGETLGLVGESGCGKSTTGRAAIRLIEPDAGEIWLEDVNILSLSGRTVRRARRRMQMIFQDPDSALNPRMKVADIVAAPLDVHKLVKTRMERNDRVTYLLKAVGLSAEHGERYPYDFSGGQKQRIGIARALAANPSLIVADEPVSALDVSIQAQVINLIRDLQREFHLTYLFISHDLGVVRHVSDTIAVMYLGRIVETAGTRELFSEPFHPYTQLLLSAIPVADPKHKRISRIITGEVPSPIDPPGGCRFHTRCPFVQSNCRYTVPLCEQARAGHLVACHWWREIKNGELTPNRTKNGSPRIRLG